MYFTLIVMLFLKSRIFRNSITKSTKIKVNNDLKVDMDILVHIWKTCVKLDGGAMNRLHVMLARVRVVFFEIHVRQAAGRGYSYFHLYT